MKLKTPEEYGYVVKDGYCLFQKGPLSQWWGGFREQESTFIDSDDSRKTEFNCAEQYMMYIKAIVMKDFEIARLVLKEKNPARHKDLGRSIKNFDADIWNKVKLETMFFGNYLKFSQNQYLKDFLLSFPEFTVFAEAAPWDKIWGIGLGPEDSRALDRTKWQGENLLGLVIQSIHYVLLHNIDHREFYDTKLRNRPICE